MSDDPGVRPVGEIFDVLGDRIEVGVWHGTVTIAFGGSEVRLTQDVAEEFGRLFIEACWQAGAA